MKSLLLSGVLALSLTLSGCSGAAVRGSLDSLQDGFDVYVEASAPAEGVDPELHQELEKQYRKHLRELRRHVR